MYIFSIFVNISNDKYVIVIVYRIINAVFYGLLGFLRKGNNYLPFCKKIFNIMQTYRKFLKWNSS